MNKEQNLENTEKALHIGGVRRSHLRFDCMYGMLDRQETPKGHPQEIMKRLGITYQHATPQSMGDQWGFWNCENIPEVLPPYLGVADWGSNGNDRLGIK